MSCALLLACLSSASLEAQAPAPAPPPASERYQVALLDLETEEVSDSGFANELTQRLRAALSARPAFVLRPTQVSLEQLSIAQDCNSGDIACLNKITRSMQLDGLVFGSVTHSGGAPVVMLRRFDFAKAAVSRNAMVNFERRNASGDELRAAAERLLDQLLLEDATQTPLAAAPATAPATHEEAPPPMAASPVVPEEAPEIAPAALLPLSDDGQPGPSVQSIVGWSLVGVAAVTAGLSLFSMYKVQHTEDEPDYREYRSAIGRFNPGVRDVCKEADAGFSYGLGDSRLHNVQSSCSTGNTFEILQYVFLGSAIIAGGLGTYLLISDDSGERGKASALRVRPVASYTSVGVDAALQF